MARALRFLASGLAGIFDVSPPVFKGGGYMPPVYYHLKAAADLRTAFKRTKDEVDKHDAEIQPRKDIGKQ